MRYGPYICSDMDSTMDRIKVDIMAVNGEKTQQQHIWDKTPADND